eukprot:gene9090-12260_t
MGNAHKNLNETMQAAQYNRHSTNYSEIKWLSVQKPVLPPTGYALIKIHASAINPVDIKTFSLSFLPTVFRVVAPLRYLAHHIIWPMEFPFTPGYEFSGVIESVTSDVSDFKVGDEVFGLNWGIKHHQDGNHPIAGGFAEYIAIRVSCLSHKPSDVPHILAASQAMVATSAHQTLNAVKLSLGHKVLILGGSTCVGFATIQLAKLRGAWVAATTSSRSFHFVKQFGADELINYNEKKWWLEDETGHRDFDMIIDCVGDPETFKNMQTEGLVKYGGTFVSLASIDAGFNPQALMPRFAFASFFAARQDTCSQNEMIKLISEKKLIIPIDEIYPFTQQGIWDIFEKIHSKKALGKNVLQIVP